MTPADTPSRPFARRLALAYAWGAGAVFVGSMAYFLYFYGAVLTGEPAGAARPVWRALLVDTLLFAAFAAHHSLMARSTAKRWLARMIPASLERATYVWIASLLFFAVCWWWQDLPGRLYRFEGWARAPFVLAQLGGMVFALRSARSIDVFDLAGIRQVRHEAPVLRDAPAAHEMGRLETDGPYRVVRHPIYLGTMLLMAATPDLTADRLLFGALSLAYLVIGIWWEERSLREEFGPAYDEYARRVRWRMIPGVY